MLLKGRTEKINVYQQNSQLKIVRYQFFGLTLNFKRSKIIIPGVNKGLSTFKIFIHIIFMMWYWYLLSREEKSECPEELSLFNSQYLSQLSKS